MLRGVWGGMPTERLTEVLLQRFKALLQVPSSVSLLFICYVPYTMSRKICYDYTVSLSIRLLLNLSHLICVYMTIHGPLILGAAVVQDGCSCTLLLLLLTTFIYYTPFSSHHQYQ